MSSYYIHPQGDSVTVTASGALPVVAELPAMSGTIKGIRLFPARFPSDAVVYMKLGDSAVTVSEVDGMPLMLVGRVPEIFAVGAETHIAIMVASGGSFDITITGGELL